ncbi:hypothetical protein AYI69_g6566, partial [Smittium culicis]
MAYSPEGIKFTVRDSVSPKVSGQLSLSIQHHRDTTARQLIVLQRATGSSYSRISIFLQAPSVRYQS